MSNSDIRFKISKVEVDDSKATLTMEALRPNDTIITSFIVESGLEDATNIRRIKEQSQKKLAEYFNNLNTLAVIEDRKKKAKLLEGKTIVPKAASFDDTVV